jgi:ubiquitin C-terminal hydrolase
MNLSVDIEKNTSLSHCLKKFSTKELLNMGDKFYCESCNTKQVATRQMMIQMRPKLLLIHLKRFKMNFQTM